MRLLRWARRLAVGAALLGLVLPAAVPALAAGDSAITGTVHSARASTTTDPAGAFNLPVPPGIYQVTVSKAGFATVSTPDIAVIAGQSVPLTVTLAEQSLSTLRTIGQVTATGHLGQINTGAATQSYVSGVQFQQLANPQINDVLQRIPDVVIEKLGTQADTAIVVGGLQPYETQVLIDGHPLAASTASGSRSIFRRT